MFLDPQQEQAFVVKGGMLWFHHILIAAVEVGKAYQVRMKWTLEFRIDRFFADQTLFTRRRFDGTKHLAS